MFFTILLYISLFLIMFVLTSIQQSYKKDNLLGIGFFTLIGIFVYSIIFGCRYNVGIDYPRYLDYYIDLVNNRLNYDRFEFLFSSITKAFAKNDIHFSIYFTFWAFLQIYFLFLAVRKEHFIFPALVFSLMIGTFWLSYMNGIRQILAFCLFAYSLQFVTNRKWLQFFLIITIASQFHLSAIILFPIYFIFRLKNQYFYNLNKQIIILTISLILLMIDFKNSMLFLFYYVANIIGYEKYSEAINSGNLVIDSLTRNRGIGFYSTLALNFYLIIISNRVKAFFNNSKYNVMYDLYFIGVVWYYMVNGSLILNRPNYYFYSFQIFIIAFTLYFVLKRGDIVLKYFNIFLILLMFIATMYRMEENTALFTFFWTK